MDYLQEIKKKETDLNELRRRHDDDYDLFRLVEFVMKDVETKQKWPNMHNVTLPAPRAFGSRVISVLHKSDRQTVVEGRNLDEKQQSKIEDFIDTAFVAADELLAEKQIPPVRAFFNTTAALRGGIASRNLVYQKDGKTIFDILPWDIRDVTWESGPKGLMWAANKKRRTAAIAKAEYPDATFSGKWVEVTEALDEEYIHTFVGSRMAKESQRHGLGYVPVMIQPVTLIPMLTLRDSMDTPWRYWGESIYAGARGVYARMNELATLFQTMSVEAYRPALQKPTMDLNEDAEVPEGPGTFQTVRPNELYQAMPKRDLYQVQLHAWTLLNGELQRITLPYIEYGEIAFELSAVASPVCKDSQSGT